MKTKLSIEIRMLAQVGYEFYRSHLIGGAPPSHTKRYQRMNDIRIGDLVIELSTAGWWMKGDKPHPGPYEYLVVENAIGIVDKIAQEPYPHAEGDMPWNTEEEGPEPQERVVYLKLLHNGVVFRWTNARFATILPIEGWEL